MIEAVLGQAPEDNPLGFMVCDLVWNTVQLGITLPLDTTKRRMQLAGGVKVCGVRCVQGGGESLLTRSCVGHQNGLVPLVRTTSPQRPYLNAFDGITRIVAEEGHAALFSGWVSHFAFSSSVIVVYYNTLL